jgi:hypothetical protein
MKGSNGEGSVCRHGRGWEAAYYLNGRRRAVPAKTARDARERLELLRKQAEEGMAVPDKRLTVADYLEYWLSVTESTLRPRTHKRYSEYVRVHTIPEIGRLRLAQLKPMHLQTAVRESAEGGSSPSTVHHLRRTRAGAADREVVDVARVPEMRRSCSSRTPRSARRSSPLPSFFSPRAPRAHAWLPCGSPVSARIRPLSRG